MIECAVAPDPNAWREWLETVTNLAVIRTLECPGALLDGATALMRAADHEGLEWRHVHDLLPASVTRHLTEAASHDALHWREVVGRLISNCAEMRVRTVSLDLGLDRVSGSGFSEQLRRRLALLEPLVGMRMAWDVTACAAVRQPPAFPGSREWDVAGNLIYELRDMRFGLCVNVAAAELGPTFDLDALLRRCALHVRVVRFLYYPHRGDALTDDFHRHWAAALRRHGFSGLVVFCPRVDDPGQLPAILGHADRWAEHYAG